MVPVLKGIRFNYLEQSLRQNSLSVYILFLGSVSNRISQNPQALVDNIYLPAWQLQEGALKLGNLQALLDGLQGPRLLGMQDAGWPKTLEIRAWFQQSAGSKSLCLWY